MNVVQRVTRRLGFALALAVSWPLATHAAVTQDWAAITQGTSGRMLALDKDNNAYVAGAVPPATMLLATYSPSGVQLWQRVFDHPLTREESNWVTLDPAGNLLWQDIIPLTFGGALRASTDASGNVCALGSGSGSGSGGLGRSRVTIKCAPDGVRLWIRSYRETPTSLHSAASMAITAAGTVIVTGGAQATVVAVASDPAGNQIWTKSIPSATAANDVAVGPQGEFYLVGGDLTPGSPKGMIVVKHHANFNELWCRPTP